MVGLEPNIIASEATSSVCLCVKAITSQDRRPRLKCRTEFCSIGERKTLLPR